MEIPALGAQIDFTSMKMAFAAKSNLNVDCSIKMLESANNAIKDIASSMEPVLLLPLLKLTSDVPSMMVMEIVSNVQSDSSPTNKISASQSVINVELGMLPPELAKAAILLLTL
eukprot:TRINITY_DN1215_c0_g1_i1.p1 TRINITY_DN1215_c0_g1~~TRINITY_DN1215_c0_g1_i1.p1  ORF type:complete len:114 (+),score=13.09 TRINITY_DN1215_c0_g1_i1:89-430(+)